VKQWLIDLAKEVDTSRHSRLAERVSLDRVWITRDGHAKVLFFRAPNVFPSTETFPVADTTQALEFLERVAECGLRGSDPGALPLSASSVLHRLGRGEFQTPGQVAVALTGLRSRPDRVTRRQRGMALALGVVSYLVGVRWLGEFFTVLVGWTLGPSIHVLADARTMGLVLSAILGLATAVVWRSGFWLRAFGIAIVSPNGREVSRLRALGRSALVWSWVPAEVLLAWLGVPAVGVVITIALIGALAYAADHPDRGLQDRLTGTYLAPR
jgi:hypothetical protein